MYADSGSVGAGVPAVLCTLAARPRADQELEWVELRALALSADEVAGGVVTTYPMRLAEAIEDLVGREADCCGSWLVADMSIEGDVVRLKITTTNPEGVGLIRTMAGLGS